MLRGFLCGVVAYIQFIAAHLQVLVDDNDQTYLATVQDSGNRYPIRMWTGESATEYNMVDMANYVGGINFDNKEMSGVWLCPSNAELSEATTSTWTTTNHQARST